MAMRPWIRAKEQRGRCNMSLRRLGRKQGGEPWCIRGDRELGPESAMAVAGRRRRFGALQRERGGGGVLLRSPRLPFIGHRGEGRPRHELGFMLPMATDRVLAESADRGRTELGARLRQARGVR